jgi:signal transduction histidine kinase
VKETPVGRRAGLLAGMRIRKKLIVLHTVFSLALASILVVALRPAVGDVVARAEIDEARLLLRTLYPTYLPSAGPVVTGTAPMDLPNVRVRRGSALEFGLDSQAAAVARSSPGEVVTASVPGEGHGAAAYLPGVGGEAGTFVGLFVIIPEARQAVWRLYMMTALTLFGVYALIAIALELFVLPRSVYQPIRTMLRAEQAVRERRASEELIPEAEIPSDELGEIMTARNQTIASLRANEAALAKALGQLEETAGDLKKKNHLLEAAQRNLADADRLVSLGMMSAGIAHELNTPLSVLKGLAEKLHQPPADPSIPSPALDADETALLLRVVRRIEKLSDGLLDFARVRPPSSTLANLRALVDEASTLVRLDRDSSAVVFRVDVAHDLILWCDTDRIVQVLVNLLRNAVDAMSKLPKGAARVIDIRAMLQHRPGAPWLSITIEDTGPGIDAAVLPRLFEPFASTRLDSKGTGLGLAVSEGIIKEHGGLLLARNRPQGDGRPGAIFEVLLPCHQPDSAPDSGAEVRPAAENAAPSHQLTL